MAKWILPEMILFQFKAHRWHKRKSSIMAKLKSWSFFIILQAWKFCWNDWINTVTNLRETVTGRTLTELIAIEILLLSPLLLLQKFKWNLNFFLQSVTTALSCTFYLHLLFTFYLSCHNKLQDFLLMCIFRCIFLPFSSL